MTSPPLAASARRPALAAFAALIVAALVATLVAIVVRSAASTGDSAIANPTDFRAFYCAGWTLLAGGDPYRVQPMMECQERAVALFGLRMLPNLVLPAPLPPYALAAFALIARLPYPLASTLWFATLVMTLGATIVAVHRLSGVRTAYVALALVGADGLASLVIGQIVPIVLLALCIAALAVRSGRDALAAAALAVAAIEPHVALPAVVALVAARPRARVPLAVAFALLGVVSLAAMGIAGNVEYVRDVLPAHARSEVTGFGAQYSLTSLLFALGVGERLAIDAGEVAYAAAVVLATLLAKRLAARHGDAAFSVVTAPALAMFGGVFVHIQQMAIALPFALMLVPYVTRGRVAIVAAVCALAIPWQSVAEMPAVANRPANARWHAPTIAAPAPDALAESPETAYIRAGGTYADTRGLAEMVVWKLPTWCALVVLAAWGRRVAVARATADRRVF